MNRMPEKFVCNLCGGVEFAPFVKIAPLGRQIVRCQSCGLAVVYPKDESFLTLDDEDRAQREVKYDNMRDIAEETGKHDEAMINLEESIRKVHFASRKDKIAQHVSSGRLLDVGCGRGFFLCNFIDSPFDFYGIEPRQRISREAADRVGDERIFCGTLKEAGFQDGRFDVVTMINLIEHLPLPRETLEEANRIMKVGALLLIETPNVGSSIAAVLKTKWHAFHEPEHHYFFSEETLSAMLAKTGFSVVKTENGSKLFSVRYCLYRLGWYQEGLRRGLERILAGSKLMEATVKIPQFDELIVLAKKVRTVP
jgi:2-polyprenyl-3-methyl-5-hydroxy-6-metoxy-1,4-benzoquinol methylase